MSFDEDKFIRGSLIILSLVLIGFGAWQIYQIIMLNVDLFLTQSTSSIEFNKMNIIFYLLLMSIGYVVYLIGRQWTNFFKGVTKFLVSWAVILLTVSVVLYAINSNSEEMTNSIQPSIDYMVAMSLDNVIENNVQIQEGTNVTLLFTESANVIKYSVENLTLEQALSLNSAFGFDETNDSERIIFLSKVIISLVSSEMSKINSKSVDAPIPLSLVKEEIESQGIDMSIFKNINLELLQEIYPPDEKAYIKILDSEIEERSVEIGNINQTTIETIWQNLNLSSNISLESKRKIIDIFLSTIIQEFEKNNIDNYQLPLASIGSMIPEEFESLLAYDILSQNISKRVEAVENFRDDCENNKINVSEICEGISMTKYENMISNFDTMIASSQMELPLNLSSTFEEYGTIEKVEEKIDSKTNLWKPLLLISVILYLLAFVTYYLHFKLFNRELILVHIPYYITKIHIINFVPTFILLGVIIFLMKTNYMLTVIQNALNVQEGIDVISLVTNLPAYEVLMNILTQVLTLCIIILIFSLVSFGIFYFLLRKEVNTREKIV